MPRFSSQRTVFYLSISLSVCQSVCTYIPGKSVPKTVLLPQTYSIDKIFPAALNLLLFMVTLLINSPTCSPKSNHYSDAQLCCLVLPDFEVYGNKLVTLFTCITYMSPFGIDLEMGSVKHCHECMPDSGKLTVVQPNWRSSLLHIFISPRWFCLICYFCSCDSVVIYSFDFTWHIPVINKSVLIYLLVQDIASKNISSILFFLMDQYYFSQCSAAIFKHILNSKILSANDLFFSYLSIILITF